VTVTRRRRPIRSLDEWGGLAAWKRTELRQPCPRRPADRYCRSVLPIARSCAAVAMADEALVRRGRKKSDRASVQGDADPLVWSTLLRGASGLRDERCLGD